MQHHRLNITSLLLVLLSFAVWQWPLPAQTIVADPGSSEAEPTAIIVLRDYSASIEQLRVPDTSRAFITQLIRLAALSKQPVKLGVILFGGDGVTVLGDASGMPTAAYESLHQSVLDTWPKPKGGTPLEEAMERCIAMVKALPRGTRVRVVLFTDGQPDSGVLQPDRYPEVRDHIERQLTALQTRYQGNSATFVQDVLSRAEATMYTPGTDDWQELYALQVKTEFEKTLQHADALKQASVRFVSVDYMGGIPELRQIHTAAGGSPDDYVLATTSTAIIPKLHALGLTALPRIIVQHPRTVDADPTRFEASWHAETDAIGEAAVVTAVFDPPLPDFSANAMLELSYDGRTRRFRPRNDDPNLTLSLDSAGNVVAATVALDTLPKDGRITLHFTSPSATLYAPACTLYTHLRMRADLQAELRPVHLPDDAVAPFRISPNHPLTFLGILRSQETAQPYPAVAMEPVLRDRQSGKELRINMQPDPQRTHVFLSDEERIPRGSYDLELHVLLPSGARITLQELQIFDVESRSEVIAIEIPLPAGDQKEGSANRGHLDFGQLGDVVTDKRLSIGIRSLAIDYPITVRPRAIALTDSQGVSPQHIWLAFSPSEILLEPGKAEKLFVRLRIPDTIEESLTDGRFEGQLVFERLDLRQPVPLRRAQSIIGIPDDAPVDLVSFTLRRPKIIARAPRGPWNALQKRHDQLALPIPVSVWEPFKRRVIIQATHTSEIEREMTLLPQATFFDHSGSKIPSVRLVPHEDVSLTQNIQPDGTARWTLDFEIDRDPEVSEAVGSLLLSGNGFRPLHIPVTVRVGDPLLGRIIRIGCFGLAGLLAVLASLAAIRCANARRHVTGRRFLLRSPQRIPGLIELLTRRGKPKVRVEKQVVAGFLSRNAPQRLRPNQTLPDNDVETLSMDDPYEICAANRKIELHSLYPSGDSYVLTGKVTSGGNFDKLSSKHSRRVWICCVLVVSLGLLGLAIFHPTVLAATQWVLDALSVS